MDFRVLTFNDNNNYSTSFDFLSIQKDESFGRAFYEHYKFIAELKGGWYSILPKSFANEKYEDYIVKMDEFCDVLFNYDNSIICPIWANSHMIDYSLFPLIISPKYYNDFCRIIYYILKHCQSHMIVLLPRFSEYEYEVIGGVIPFKKFMQMLENEQILCGINYIITL